MDGTDHRRPTQSCRRIGLGLLAVSVVGGYALFLASCDTVARIGFTSRKFDKVESSGFIAPGGSCGNFGEEGSTARLRFVMLDDRNDTTPIRPESAGGRSIDKQVVTEQNLDGEVSDGRIFQAPDLFCGGAGTGSLRGPGSSFPSNHDGSSGDASSGDAANGDAGNMTDTGGSDADNGNGGTDPSMVTCNSNKGYSCTRSLPGNQGGDIQRRCSKTTNLTWDDVRFLSDTDKNQLFGVLIENTGSVGGYRPQENVNQLYYDKDGDGVADGDEALYTQDGTTQRNPVSSPVPSIASDDNDQRYSSLSSLIANWEDAKKAAKPGVATSFGLWDMNGDRNPPSLVNEYLGENRDQSWTSKTNNPNVVRNAVDLFIQGHPPTERRANVLESTQQLIENAYTADGRFENYDKTLVVVVDGPPEVHPDETSVTTEDVIRSANDANVRLFIVQFDSRLNSEAVFDDYGYVDQQNEQCSGDDTCRPWEECREMHGWAEEAGPVQEGEYYKEGTWCLPKRRSADGRTGPIEAYGRMACETRGGYQYVKANSALRWALPWLPFTMDGLWEADVTIQQIGRKQYSPNTGVQLQSSLEVSIGDSTVTKEFSQAGAQEQQDEPTSDDNRSVVFTGSDQ